MGGDEVLQLVVKINTISAGIYSFCSRPDSESEMIEIRHQQVEIIFITLFSSSLCLLLSGLRSPHFLNPLPLFIERCS